VSLGTHEFGAVPLEEGLRRASDSRGVAEQAEADGAALPLVDKGPAQSEDQAHQPTMRLEAL
jgi:hypothetical protein